MLFLALGDLDRDGRVDVLSAARENRLLFCRGTPGGWTEHSIRLPDEFRYGKGVAIGDLDVMSCEEVANLGVFWYENPGK